ncbi:hypothetical protein AAF712_008440 [Marasmius tenuissimus]|uniref:Uncharacterized protein n=1 Tax=Marasmius tenuissimus TaxID=585030 RepID=A0ABR2ZUW5_9AGAR
MLCLTCQQGLGSSGNGIDAGVGAYQAYLNAGRSNNAFCSPQVNKTLPADVQSAICNKDIKIYDDLYNIFWGDGAWYVLTITKDQAANPNKVFTKCPAKTSSLSSTSPTSPAASSSSTGSPAQSGSDGSESGGGLGTGAIAGIAVGIVALVIAGALGAFFFFKRRKRTQYVGASGFSIDGSQGAPGPPPNPYPYTPTTVSHHPPPASSASGSTSQYYSSQPPMTSTGSYFPASASAASYHPNYGVAPQHSTSGGTSQSGSGHGSSSAYGSNAGFVVSNPDGGRGGGSASGSMPNPHSPQSPRSPPPLPGKGAAPNAGMTYVPAAPSSQADSSERHLDAGPVGGSSLQRNTSGRLPPAYGDLMRDSS